MKNKFISNSKKLFLTLVGGKYDKFQNFCYTRERNFYEDVCVKTHINFSGEKLEMSGLLGNLYAVILKGVQYII